MHTTTRHRWWLGILLVSTLALGCGSAAVEHATDAAPGEPAAAANADDHSGWWCVEHGVPEDICGLCNSKLAAEFQKQGDWCAAHDRPESQCFACHPELEAQFAARYEAKFGTKPPKPEG